MSTQTSARERLAKRIAGEIALSDEPGRSMRVWRERFRLPQIVLAEYLSISPSVISDYESGRRKSPGTSTIRRFVMALLALDERNGGQVISAFLRLMDVSLVDMNIVLAMSDFTTPVTIDGFREKLKCDMLYPQKGGVDYSLMKREIFGYTLVDVERAVKELDSEAFLKLFGATTERCLVFTKVNTGRAPMIAIKSQEFKPTMVILHGVGEVDRLAIELAEQMRIPLGVSRISSLENLIKELRSTDQT
jgi:putative transcriptional regulator